MAIEPMPSNDWEKIQELFLAAADLPPDEQRDFLDSACADYPERRREVESLLASDSNGEQSIAEAVTGAAQDLLGEDPLLGQRLGHWRVVREIGRGGMGAVYLATRDDRDYRQQAAIKLVKEGMDTAQLLDRFRHERQILANLNHPYIARLIDGGSTGQGRPYLVMEYVEGQPIDAWLRQRRAGLEERCRLFLLVCEAVSYAHRNLVVHRDLKPGNILVAPGGLPKLLDFGVAKLLAPDRDSSTTFAGTDMRAITPDYASPEQVLGQPVTTTTDVYSLGAILYELATGSHPRPERPRRALPGDLDNIVRMAMRQEPERRYPSVDEFAADLRRYLAGEPVVARRDSVTYRVGKFARRHWIGLTMVCLVAASLLAGTVMALNQAHRADAARALADAHRRSADLARQSADAARQIAESEHQAASRERDSALRERARAEAEARLADERLSQMVGLANHSLFDIHSQIESLPGSTEARREIVNTTLRYLEELSRTAGNDARLGLAVAAAYLKLGDVQGYPYGPSLGDRAGALRSYRLAVERLALLRPGHPGDPDILGPWVNLQERIAMLLAAGGKVDEATACLRGAFADAELLGKLRPDDPDALSLEASLWEAMAVALESRDMPAAASWAQRALPVFETLAARFPARDDLRERLADACSRAGVGLIGLGNLRDAMREFRKAAEIREGLVRDRPNDVARRRNLMLAYGHVAAVLGSPLGANLGDSEGARQYFQKAVALAEQIAAADPRNATAQYDLAAAMLRLGIVDAPPTGLEAALASLRGAAAKLEALLSATPGDPRYRTQLAIAREFIGQRLLELGRLPESVAAYRQSLAAADALLAADPANRAVYAQAAASSRGLVRALAVSGARAEALAEARAAFVRAEACVTRGAERNSCARYGALAWLSQASAYRIFAQVPEAAAEARAADWREARSAAERTLREIAAIPGAEGHSPYVALLAEARALIAASDAQAR